MTANKAQRNTQIPIKAIERPAGMEDNCIILASSTEICCANEVERPTKKDVKTISTNSEERDIVYSTDLQKGMSIAVKNGGIKETLNKSVLFMHKNLIYFFWTCYILILIPRYNMQMYMFNLLSNTIINLKSSPITM